MPGLALHRGSMLPVVGVGWPICLSISHLQHLHGSPGAFGGALYTTAGLRDVHTVCLCIQSCCLHALSGCHSSKGDSMPICTVKISSQLALQAVEGLHSVLLLVCVVRLSLKER